MFWLAIALITTGCASSGRFVQPEDYDVDDMYDYQGFDGYLDAAPKGVDNPVPKSHIKKIKPSLGPSIKDRANP